MSDTTIDVIELFVLLAILLLVVLRPPVQCRRTKEDREQDHVDYGDYDE